MLGDHVLVLPPRLRRHHDGRRPREGRYPVEVGGAVDGIESVRVQLDVEVARKLSGFGCGLQSLVGSLEVDLDAVEVKHLEDKNVLSKAR